MQQLQKVNISFFVHMTSILMHFETEKNKKNSVIYSRSNNVRNAFYQHCQTAMVLRLKISNIEYNNLYIDHVYSFHSLKEMQLVEKQNLFKFHGQHLEQQKRLHRLNGSSGCNLNLPIMQVVCGNNKLEKYDLEC